MAKGGKDNRSFRSQRRRKRKFHSNRYTTNKKPKLNVDPASLESEATSGAAASCDFIVSSSSTEPCAHRESSSEEECFDVSTSSEINMNQQHQTQHPTTTTPVSHSKLTSTTSLIQVASKNVLTGNRIIDMDILRNVFAILSCPECKESHLSCTQNKKQGLAFEMKLECLECDWCYNFWTSKKKSKSRNFDVNSRIFYSMRRIGKGYQGMRRFLTLMNHPSPMTEKTYRKITYNFNKAIKTVAKKIMKQACQELQKKSESSVADVCNVGVSVDGTWQRRGFSSLNGAVAAISIDTGCVLDIEIMSRYCQGCTNAQVYKTSDPDKFEKLKFDHICKINHVGSAPAMEVSGTKKIFERSVELNQLRYTEFYGDGDSKSFPAVKDVYPGVIVRKKECIGHVQKRVGTRLRKLKLKVKGLGGKGRLTDAVVDKLQNYYGIAVRSNIGDLKGMQSAINAALFHVASSKVNNYHDHCPVGPNSWCTFQNDKVNGTNQYKPGPGLPLDVIKHVQ